MKSVTRYLSVLLLLTAIGQVRALDHHLRADHSFSNACEAVACPEVFTPLCASDGNVYGNACFFGIAKCLDDQLAIVEPEKCGIKPLGGADSDLSMASASVGSSDSISTFASASTSGSTEVPTRCALFCPMDFTPVCGTDGTTYSNRCSLDTANCLGSNVEYAYEGQCWQDVMQRPDMDCVRQCPPEEIPVCASDGATYLSECVLQNAMCIDPDLSLVRHGACEEAPLADVSGSQDSECPDFCTFEYLPLCGSDGMTYANACQFKVAQCLDSQLEVASDGECQLPADYSGSSDQQDGSPSAWMEQSSDVSSSSQSNSSRCAFFCTFEYLPVCGSDACTYANECMFTRAQCEHEELTMAHQGECALSSSSSSSLSSYPTEFSTSYDCESVSTCTQEYVPVCGSDGVTYPNRCVFDRVQCSSNDNTLQLAHEGDCTSQDPRGLDVLCDLECFPLYYPVCGNDGITYTSPCHLMHARCQQPNLEQVAEGVCWTAPQSG